MTTTAIATSPVTKIAANQTRRYVRTELPIAHFPGAQRRQVLQAITEHEGPATALELVPALEKLGLVSKTPIAASAAYHLHHLCALGYVRLAS